MSYAMLIGFLVLGWLLSLTLSGIQVAGVLLVCSMKGVTKSWLVPGLRALTARAFFAISQVKAKIG